MSDRSPMTPAEAFEKWNNFVLSDSLGFRYNNVNDRVVWHYTSIAGFSGILDSSCLWASDYRYMNDTSEIYFGLEIVEMSIAHPQTTPEIGRELRQEILKEIILFRDNLSDMNVFSSSFCLRGNVLSQWRAYARQDGIAIGFRKGYIEERARAAGFLFGRVHYFSPHRDKILPGHLKLGSWLKERISSLLQMLDEAGRKLSADERADEEELDMRNSAAGWSRSDLIEGWLAETVSFIKHPAFEAEDEWRLVRIKRASLFGIDDDMKHRSSGATIVPYIEMPLNLIEERERAIETIVLGPNADGRATRASIKFLIAKHRLINISYVSPFNPLSPIR